MYLDLPENAPAPDRSSAARMPADEGALRAAWAPGAGRQARIGHAVLAGLIADEATFARRVQQAAARRAAAPEAR